MTLKLKEIGVRYFRLIRMCAFESLIVLCVWMAASNKQAFRQLWPVKKLFPGYPFFAPQSPSGGLIPSHTKHH
jgi:hypothetical protein